MSCTYICETEALRRCAYNPSRDCVAKAVEKLACDPVCAIRLMLLSMQEPGNSDVPSRMDTQMLHQLRVLRLVVIVHLALFVGSLVIRRRR